MEHSNLDDQIKKALENFQAEYQEDHWELMQQKLNDSANADLAERADEHILRQKLTQIKPEAPAEHWDLMAAKLAALNAEPLLEDALVDGVVYENLKELKVPYKAEHWDLMEEKIAQELHWRNKVVRYKVVELALAFLFVFTFFQYWPDAKKIIPKLIKQQHVQQPIAAQQVTGAQLETANSIIAENNSDEINAIEQTASTVSESASASTVSAPTQENTKTQDNFTTVITATTFKTEQNAKVQHLPVLTTEKENRSFDELTPIASRNTPIDLKSLDKNQDINTGIITNRQDYLFSDFALLASHETWPLENPDVHLPDCKDCNKSKTPRYFRIGMMGQGTFDLINSNSVPSSTLNKESEAVALSAIEQGTFGFGGGLTIGFKNNRWELESGIGYSSKYIKPQLVNVVLDRGNLLDGYSGYGWIGSQIDLLQLPVNMRFDFLNKPKWKVYGQGGMNLNLAFNSIDRYVQHHVESVSFIDGYTVVSNPSAPDARDNAVENERPVNPVTPVSTEPAVLSNNAGISSGGTIKSNSFLNLNLGFGIERQFSTRYSFFLQSNYHHFLGGGFKNTDLQIHSASVQTGFKISLKKKAKPTINPGFRNSTEQTFHLKK